MPGASQVSAHQPPRSSSSVREPGPLRLPTGGAVVFVGPQPPDQVRNFLAAADVCVIPSVRTRGFREPWGLVANEAMNQSTPVIASEEVGAVAGGLVRHERNGLVVPAGDASALAGALRRWHDYSACAPRRANAPRTIGAARRRGPGHRLSGRAGLRAFHQRPRRR